MSSLLQNVIVAHRCRSTHHFMAMEALNLMNGPDADAWRDLLLVEHMSLLTGAKAPDAEFKDFRNHVLHVSEGEWGGARDAAAEWYGKSVEALRDRQWSMAAYALGVLSHYFSDPCQPFHTGQTEEEGSIHRAVEWSIAKSRAEICRRIEAKGYPDVPAGDGPGFVSDMVLEGAKRSHPHYQTFIDHYDIHAGVKDPPAGLDDTMLDAIADLCAYATKGMAVLYERAFAEAGVKPKKVNLTLHGYLSTLDIPVHWVAKKMDDAGDRKTVTAMYKELQETGKVIRKLPDDDKAIRRLHARQVLRVPIKQLDAQPAKPTGARHTPRTGIAEPLSPAPAEVIEAEPEAKAAETIPVTPAPKPVTAPEKSAPDTTPETAPIAAGTGAEDVFIASDSGLTLDSDVVDAPSIGPKTADRLATIGITTVADLLDANPMDSADALDTGYITAESFADWQDQTRLKMAMPSLRVHDVQILVGANIRTVEDLASTSVKELLAASMAFVETPEARRIIAGSSAPDEAEVEGWIGLAKAAES